MTYPEIVQYLGSFVDYEKAAGYPYRESLKLERIKGFLEMRGNPQEGLRYLHIAGTKGKGSTCAFIAYILREAGYSVGLYSSPHLSDFRERIRVLDPHPEAAGPDDPFEGMIPKDEISLLVSSLKPAVEDYNRYSKRGPLSFFELYTSMAFIYFKEKNVDFAVLETGLGGRFDATNVVNPLVAAITPISYEHTQYLGRTLKEIAFEKAGIIKNNLLGVISAPQEEEAAQVIRQRCRQEGALLYEVGRDIIYEGCEKAFDVAGALGGYAGLNIGLAGKHQLINAAVAVAAAGLLDKHNIHIGYGAIKKGLRNTLWPARCEVISVSPLVILDGAQNAASARALKEAVKENFKYRKLVLVFGISADKDIKGVCAQIGDLAEKIILTKSVNPRAKEPELLAGYFKGKEVHITNNVKEAKVLAASITGKEDMVLVCGSLFVAGEFRDAGV
ncbi:MAG: folylpolyglutamate synthase/dihydrofolate synthase family protein [Candidatus Omnitrophota bacterium]|jgi:dihydrofolate synthase/folylpolyglutamate synthase